MSRKAAIIVLASVAVAIGLGAIINAVTFMGIDPDSMPVCSLQYTGQDNSQKQIALNLSGYHWKEKNPTTGVKSWGTAGPENFFSEKYAIKGFLPGNPEVQLHLTWNIPPDQIIIKWWPISEWTPGAFESNHSQGINVSKSWKTIWKMTDIGFDVERGSLYGVWFYYGDAWVEYSFMVPAEDPTDYDYLGYFLGFETPRADQFKIDPIEWIDASDTERIDELNLNLDNDFPGGFYIYNPMKDAISLQLTDHTQYSIIDPETGNTSKTVDRTEFLNHLRQSPNFSETTPFWILETDGKVEFIKEHYVP